MRRKIIAGIAVAILITGLTTGCRQTSKAANDKWDAENEITVISREDGSGTRGAFIELMGIEEKVDGEKVDMTTQEAQITNSTAVMMTTVEEDEYAIGYISLGSLKNTVKALKVDGVTPSEEAIKAGNYKVARPFNVVTVKEKESELAKDFMSFILSREGQEVVKEENYIPLTDVNDFNGTLPKGKIVAGGSSSVSPLMEKLIEAYQQINKNAEIELQTTDSTTGVSATLEGNYDIGMVSRDVTADEKDKGVTPLEIAKDGIVVIANQDNPMNDISSDAVKDIYTGEAITWGEVID